MSEDRLVQHRLEQLERLGEGWLEAQRRMEVLTLSQAAIEKSVASIAESLEKSAVSMTRLHERLDESLREKAKEEGREEGRAQARAEIETAAEEVGRRRGLDEAKRTTWKVVAFTVSTTIATGLLVVAALNFALN